MIILFKTIFFSVRQIDSNGISTMEICKGNKHAIFPIEEKYLRYDKSKIICIDFVVLVIDRTHIMTG